MTRDFRAFAIVPAAGRSRRMGQDKLLMPWNSGTVIEAVIAAWRRSEVDHIVLVTRAEHEELVDVARRAGAVVVASDEPLPEMKDSVAAGLRYVERTLRPVAADAWLLAPADQPRMNAEVVRQLLAAHNPRSPRLLTPVIHGRRGHPVLFPWPLAAEVSRLDANQGINAVVHRHTAREISVSDPTVLDDLDTPADYARLRDERRLDNDR